jgi:glutathione S-transferase
MYTVIGSTNTRTLRVLWLLEELGQAYTHITAAPQSAEARAHNPVGKVPTLIDGAASITDSTAIMTYLADKHGAFTAKAGTPDRAQQDSLTHFLLDEFDALLWMSARHSFVLPEDMRLPAIKESLKWEYARNLGRLAARLKGPYLMGDEMTVPDILAAQCLSWGLAAKFPSPEGALADYLAMMRARPAYLRATAR